MIKNKYIKKFSKNGIAIALVTLLVIGFTGPSSAHAFASPSTVTLGGAGNFTILAKTAITTTGATSITGDIGVSPAAASTMTGFGLVLDSSGQFSKSPLVSGKVYASDYTSPTPSTLTTAVNDMLTAYNDAAGRAADSTNFNSGNLGGQILTTGIYKFTTDVTIPTNLTLNGSATDVWIFEISGDLSIASATSVLLTGGALPKNIFWQVGGSTGATLGSTSTFNGNILSAKQIIMGSGATLNGRALAQTQATLIANTVSFPAGAGSPDLTFSSDTTIGLGVGNFTILSGSTATSMIVGGANNTTFAVTVPALSTFTFVSPQSFLLTNDQSVAQICTNSQNSVTITGPQTVVFTPVATVCAVPAGNGGTSSGGGGGGGTVADTTAPSGTSVSINAGASTTSTLTSTLTLTATDAVGVTQMLISNDAGFAGATWEAFAATKAWLLASGDGVKTVYAKFRDAALNMSAAVSDSITVSGSGTVAVVVTTPNPTQGCSGGNQYNTSTGALCINNAPPQGCSGGNMFNISNGQACNNNVTLTITAGHGAYLLGTVTLKNGSKGEAVKELQKLLNKILKLGLAEDGKLGPKTIAVIKKWQKAHGLKADGLVGAKTKAKMKAEAEAN